MQKNHPGWLKSCKTILTPFNLLIAIGIALFLGRTIDLFDPYGVNYKLAIDGLSIITAILFIMFVCVAFSERKLVKQSKEKK